MKKSKEQEYFEKWIEKKIPKNLWQHFQQMIDAMHVGFDEGIRYESERNRLKNSENCVT
jgi:hypothetical protein